MLLGSHIWSIELCHCWWPCVNFNGHFSYWELECTRKKVTKTCCTADNYRTQRWQGEPCWMGHVWWPYMISWKEEWMVSQQEEGEDYRCYMIWQKVIAMLHSNDQLKKGRDGDKVEWYQKPAVQRSKEDIVAVSVVKSRWLCYFVESTSICLNVYSVESRSSLKISTF